MIKKTNQMRKVALFFAICFVSCLSLKAQDSLNQYVAKYKFPEGSAVLQVDVILENGVLMVNSAMGSASLEKKGVDTFAMPSYNGTVVFTRNEAKKIIGIKIDVMNILLEGIREENNINSSGDAEIIWPLKFPLPKLQ